jgi:hypothetical protein
MAADALPVKSDLDSRPVDGRLWIAAWHERQAGGRVPAGLWWWHPLHNVSMVPWKRIASALERTEASSRATILA